MSSIRLAIVRAHLPGDHELLNIAPFYENILVLENGITVGNFGDWELESAG